jgi:hypothetical protein
MIALKKLHDRLIGVRSIAPVVFDDVESLGQALGAVMRELTGGMLMIVDLRPCGIVPLPIAERIIELQRRDNPALIRAAYLITEDQGGLGLQLSRMLRATSHPARRAFDDKPAAVRWLGEVSTEPEKRALTAFLDQGSTLQRASSASRS